MRAYLISEGDDAGFISEDGDPKGQQPARAQAQDRALSHGIALGSGGLTLGNVSPSDAPASS